MKRVLGQLLAASSLFFLFMEYGLEAGGKQVSIEERRISEICLAKGVTQGDLTLDGEIDIRDTIISLRLILGLDLNIGGQVYSFPYPEWLLQIGDIDEDGVLDISDGLRIFRKAIGLPALVRWAKTYEPVESPFFWGFSLVRNTVDNGYVCAGNFWGGFVWVLKIDADGNIVWQKKYGPEQGNDSIGFEIKDIRATTDGGLIVSGGASYHDNALLSHCLGWLMRLDSRGNIIWQKSYEFEGPTSFEAGIETGDGGFLLGGYGHALGEVTAHCKPLILKVDQEGNILWKWFLDTKDKCLGDNSLVKTVSEVNGDYVVGGQIYSRLTGDGSQETDGFDIFVA
ncbi:MAG: hypothetical protein NC911_00445, partial [Candidatus Omnitrophica bacterium]|nr:hypothetical protein [Candidatus Omnitrophota bacterium]